MSAARAAVCERLAAIRRAVDDFRLRDEPPTPQTAARNASVRVIRNGLAVQCFNVLEDFVRARSVEVLTSLSTSSVPFRHFPNTLQRAVTIDVVKAITFQTRLREKQDHVPYAQQYSGMIASTATTPMALADIAFFHAASNVGKDQFRDALAAFGVDKPWKQVSGLCSRMGLSALPSDLVFSGLAQRRHHAAHNASADVSELDLTQSVIDALGLAVSFDILLSRASAHLRALKQPPLPTAHFVSDHRHIPLRFIRAAGNRFAEVREGARRNTRVGISVAQLLKGARARTARENGALVVFDSTSTVVDWAA